MVSIRNSCGHRGFLYSHSGVKGVGMEVVLRRWIGKRISFPFLPLIVKKQNKLMTAPPHWDIKTLTDVRGTGPKIIVNRSLSHHHRVVIGKMFKRACDTSFSRVQRSAAGRACEKLVQICLEIPINHTGAGCDWDFPFPRAILGVCMEMWVRRESEQNVCKKMGRHQQEPG
jgi:hypothetical protein